MCCRWISSFFVDYASLLLKSRMINNSVQEYLWIAKVSIEKVLETHEGAPWLNGELTSC